MSLEFFAGSESSEGISEAALEQLKEKMRAAAAQIAAIKKEEGKQRKKEDELLKILFAFLKDSKKIELIVYISRCLEQNIPAAFILSIILLGNQDIQQATGIYLLPKSVDSMLDQHGEDGIPQQESRALVFFGENHSLPLKIRIEMDQWLKEMLFQAMETPHKILKSSYTYINDVKEIKPQLIDLTTYVVQDFLQQNSRPEEWAATANFSNFTLRGVLNRAQESLDERQTLGEGS